MEAGCAMITISVSRFSKGKSIVVRVFTVSISTDVLVGTFFVAFGFFPQGGFEIDQCYSRQPLQERSFYYIRCSRNQRCRFQRL